MESTIIKSGVRHQLHQELNQGWFLQEAKYFLLSFTFSRSAALSAAPILHPLHRARVDLQCNCYLHH